MFHVDIMQTNSPPDIFYGEAPQTRKKKKKESCTGYLLSDINDRVIGFFFKAGNWKILQIKTARISKFTAYCAIWA